MRSEGKCQLGIIGAPKWGGGGAIGLQPLPQSEIKEKNTQILQTRRYQIRTDVGKYLFVDRSMIDKLIEVGRCYGMEMNVEKTKVVRISRQPSPVTIMIGKNNWTMWNVLIIWVAC